MATGATISSCESLLQSGSDEQRFVGLLLATRLVQGPEDLTRVFDSGIQFVRRLLLSAPPAQDGGEEPGNAYRSLALSVLASFAAEQGLVALGCLSITKAADPIHAALRGVSSPIRLKTPDPVGKDKAIASERNSGLGKA